MQEPSLGCPAVGEGSGRLLIPPRIQKCLRDTDVQANLSLSLSLSFFLSALSVATLTVEPQKKLVNSSLRRKLAHSASTLGEVPVVPRGGLNRVAGPNSAL